MQGAGRAAAGSLNRLHHDGCVLGLHDALALLLPAAARAVNNHYAISVTSTSCCASMLVCSTAYTEMLHLEPCHDDTQVAEAALGTTLHARRSLMGRILLMSTSAAPYASRCASQTGTTYSEGQGGVPGRAMGQDGGAQELLQSVVEPREAEHGLQHHVLAGLHPHHLLELLPRLRTGGAFKRDRCSPCTLSKAHACPTKLLQWMSHKLTMCRAVQVSSRRTLSWSVCQKSSDTSYGQGAHLNQHRHGTELTLHNT